jgi:hypothetical protein
MNREKIVRIIKEEISKKLKESRADQIRREIDDAVNGTDYGYTPKDTGEDPTIARGRGLEIDKPVGKTHDLSRFNLDVNGKRTWSNQSRNQHEKWSLDGKLHRIDGPAFISFDRYGIKDSELFYLNGIHVDEDDYSEITGWERKNPRFSLDLEDGKKEEKVEKKVEIDDDGNKYETWTLPDGTDHNPSGPSIIWTKPDGSVKNFFSLNGYPLSQKEYSKRTGWSPSRFDLDLDGESEGMKPIDDKELEARGRGLDLDDAKNRPEKEDRFKPSIAGQKLTEKKVRLNKTKTRLILI